MTVRDLPVKPPAMPRRYFVLQGAVAFAIKREGIAIKAARSKTPSTVKTQRRARYRLRKTDRAKRELTAYKLSRMVT